MALPRILVLADDLTGALEAGAQFRGSVVLTTPEHGCSAPIIVIDTETRHSSPGDAARIVSACARQFPAEIIYKKTDSTLRGNIGAELNALPGAHIHYVPAYPRMKRTVRSGILYVDGIPVHQTAFARDPLNPVAESNILRVLQAQGADLARITVHDGETDADVLAAAQAVLQSPPPILAAGPAALAGCLADLLNLAPSPSQIWPEVPECVIINGSLHAASAAQIRQAEEHNLPQSGWRTGAAHRDARALIVFGGDTARSVLALFGDPPLHPLGEPLPGVPLSTFTCNGRSHILITKAGGFGEPDLLCRLHALLCHTGDS